MLPSRTHHFALSLAVVSSLALAGCSTSAEVSPEPTTPLPTATQTPVPEDTGDVLRELYAEVLDAPEEYSFTTGADYSLNGDYSYALADITGDENPELLLRAGTSEHLDPIRIFTSTADGTLLSPADTLLAGAAGAGGYRVNIFAAPAGDRIYQGEWYSLSSEMTVKAFDIKGDRLLPTGEEFADHPTASSARILPLSFLDIDDRSALDTLRPTWKDTQESAPDPSTPSPPASGDRANTFTGTVRVMTAPELARHQGYAQTPNGEDDSYRFALLILDSPTMLTGRHSGNPGPPQPREATMIALGEISPHSSVATGFDLNGQELTITIDPEKCAFPSDASLPLGEPRCSDVSIH